MKSIDRRSSTHSSMMPSEIISFLPYDDPFLFVDDLAEVHDEGAIGYYTYPKNAFFYRGHFKNYPVTPGVILIETMAQIGVVCLGIFLVRDQISINDFEGMAMTSSEVEYLLPVFPGEKVKVISEKVYFRFGKLKCICKMINEEGKVVCQGTIAGILKRSK